MATTTTNYGWTVPTSSDLVKNGATAISTVGQSVDTFLFRPFTRNGVLNSGLNVWQRGTSSALTSSGVYFADRWQGYRSVAGSTASRQVTNDTTNLPNIQYCARIQRDSGNTGTQNILVSQSFESVNSIPYAGKTVTFSFYARAGANFSAASSQITAQLATGTGTDQNVMMTGYTGNAATINQTPTLTTTWQRFSYSATIPAATTEIAPYFTFVPVGTAGVNDYYEITGIMVEVGNQASPYASATPTYATELAACQRYYYRMATADVIGYAASTSIVDAIFPTPSMRTAPTSIDQSGYAVYTIVAGANYTGGTVVSVSAGPNFAKIRYTHGTPVFVLGATCDCSATFLGLSAEL
jgi:hypothetical protein